MSSSSSCVQYCTNSTNPVCHFHRGPPARFLAGVTGHWGSAAGSDWSWARRCSKWDSPSGPLPGDICHGHWACRHYSRGSLPSESKDMLKNLSKYVGIYIERYNGEYVEIYVGRYVEKYVGRDAIGSDRKNNISECERKTKKNLTNIITKSKPGS